MTTRSLLDMAYKTVLENIDTYDKDYAKQIIGVVRDKRVNEMWHEVENHHRHCDGNGNHMDKLWATLPCLINSRKYIKFDTAVLTRMRCKSSTISNSRFQEFIRCLGSNTPNLVELNIDSPGGDQKYSLEERELASIAKLKHLKTLNIEYQVCVHLSGFHDLTHQCEKLESIDVEQVFIDVEPSRDTFCDKFVYIDIDASRYLEERQVVLSLKSSMPEDGPDCADTTQYMRIFLAPMKVAQISLLRGFTKLTEIQLACTPTKEIETLDEFPHFPEVKFAELSCMWTSAHAVRCFMKRNGLTLQKLVLEGISAKENMTFYEIFSTCPNLESLQLVLCNLTGNDAPVEAMRRLKKFRWCHLNENSHGRVAFSSILSAPLLEELDIELPKIIDFSDNATVIARINGHEILRNLKKCRMVEMRRKTYQERKKSSVAFKELKSAILSVISS